MGWGQCLSLAGPFAIVQFFHVSADPYGMTQEWLGLPGRFVMVQLPLRPGHINDKLSESAFPLGRGIKLCLAGPYGIVECTDSADAPGMISQLGWYNIPIGWSIWNLMIVPPASLYVLRSFYSTKLIDSEIV
jgi:hypothetical protein